MRHGPFETVPAYHDQGHCGQASGVPAADAPPAYPDIGRDPDRLPEYRQIDRVVQEIDGLAKVLIGDETHYYRVDRSAGVTGACRRDDHSEGSSSP